MDATSHSSKSAARFAICKSITAPLHHAIKPFHCNGINDLETAPFKEATNTACFLRRPRFARTAAPPPACTAQRLRAPRAKKALAPGRPPAGGERPSEQKSALRERDALSSRGLPRSTFGDGGLSFRVRNGTGRSPPPWSRSRGALPRGSLAAQGALRATLAVAQRFDWRTPTGRP